jgi:hypothetical protein
MPQTAEPSKKGEKVSECQAAASVVLPWDVTQEVMRSMHQCCQLVPNAQTVSISIHTLTADLGCKVPARNQKNITHFVPTRNQTQMSTSAFCQPILTLASTLSIVEVKLGYTLHRPYANICFQLQDWSIMLPLSCHKNASQGGVNPWMHDCHQQHKPWPLKPAVK